MKRMLLILTLLLVAVTLYPADAAYYDHHILFSLEKSERPLTAEERETLDTPYPQLNAFIKKYNVLRIEPWLSHARPGDHDGEIYLNRIYRLVLDRDVQAGTPLVNELRQSAAAINRAEREPVMRKHAVVNDPYIGNQWFLNKVLAPEAWGLWDLEAGEVPGDSNVVIAIVDDGVEYTHPDLRENIWINQDEIPSIYFGMADEDGDGFVGPHEAAVFCGDQNGNGRPDLKDVIHSNSLFVDGSDTDGDGYVDNLIGWDTDEYGGSADDDKDPMPVNNSHGTHVAGLAGAVTNNGTGVASVAYNISIMPVKATGDAVSENINTGYDGMLYAAQAGADIINCSWGGPGYSSYMQNQINVLYDQYGAIVVAAAGNGDNEGNPSDEAHYPSGYKNVVSVTAVSSSDIFSWASYGAPDTANNFYGVDIAAPGENMYSTYLSKEAYYASLRGTSMASPLVASCLGLLKSAYPDSSREWLIRRLVENSDSIDHLNPGYEGQLGSGRVNILKALVYDKWPRLEYAGHTESIISGDADSVLNPGETAGIMIELKNAPGWTKAGSVTGILRTNDPRIGITDSIAVWSNIFPDSSSQNDDNGFQIVFSDKMPPDDYPFQLELLANQTSEYPYSSVLDLEISLYLDQQGFPVFTDNAVDAAVLFLDIGNDGQEEIVFGDKSGNVYIVNADGEVLDGFPVALDGQIGGIAAADIDLDGTTEIVVTLFEKAVHVYDTNGDHEWSRHPGGFVPAVPAIGNLDADPELEIVVGAYDQKLYVMNHDSSYTAPFPVNAGQNIRAGVSLADLDNDGRDEIVFGGMNGDVNILDGDGSSFSGWPQSTSGSVSGEPFVYVNGENSALILSGNDQGDIYGYDLDGTRRFMIDGSGAVKASPAVYERDGSLFAAFGTTAGNLYLVDVLNGEVVSGWPRTVSPLYQSPACADVVPDTENTPHIIAMGNDGNIYAFSPAAETVPGFPVNTRFLSRSSPAVADIDNDNDNEIICGTYSGLSVIDLKDTAGEIFWPMHRGDPERRGAIRNVSSPVRDIDLPFDFDFELIGNVPNPFNPETQIRYIVPGSSPVQLRVYSLDGKRMIEREIAEPEIGMNSIKIDMSPYASGVYLYTLRQGSEVRKAKMIFMK